MAEESAHPETAAALAALARRIATLKTTLHPQHEKRGELEALDRRHRALEERFRAAARPGGGFNAGVKADIEKVAADLKGAVETLIETTDEG